MSQASRVPTIRQADVGGQAEVEAGELEHRGWRRAKKGAEGSGQRRRSKVRSKTGSNQDLEADASGESIHARNDELAQNNDTDRLIRCTNEKTTINR